MPLKLFTLLSAWLYNSRGSNGWKGSSAVDSYFNRFNASKGYMGMGSYSGTGLLKMRSRCCGWVEERGNIVCDLSFAIVNWWRELWTLLQCGSGDEECRRGTNDLRVQCRWSSMMIYSSSNAFTCFRKVTGDTLVVYRTLSLVRVYYFDELVS
jgi:hypothetical protein